MRVTAALSEAREVISDLAFAEHSAMVLLPYVFDQMSRVLR